MTEEDIVRNHTASIILPQYNTYTASILLHFWMYSIVEESRLLRICCKKNAWLISATFQCYWSRTFVWYKNDINPIPIQIIYICNVCNGIWVQEECPIKVEIIIVPLQHMKNAGFNLFLILCLLILTSFGMKNGSFSEQ